MKAYTIILESANLILQYQSEYDWVGETLNSEKTIQLKRDNGANPVFIFHVNDVIKRPNHNIINEFGEPIDSTWLFKIGELVEDGYYKIPGRILSIQHDVFIYKTIAITMDFFSARVLNTRIMPIIDGVINAPLVIGGNRADAIPEQEYLEIINLLPDNQELHLYAKSRIEGVLREYFPNTLETGLMLSDKIRRKYKRAKKILECKNTKAAETLSAMREMDCVKFRLISEHLEKMLNESNQFTEAVWQNEIEKIILFIFPQYIAKLTQLTMPKAIDIGNNLRPDIVLVSMDGCVDIVEIKRPENNQLLSRKANYRGNYIPSRDLSSAVMQAEKYIANLERWGANGETIVSKKSGIPSVRIRQPRAILILGRDSELDCEQKRSDFEIIKRKFAHMLDIVTYDDLVGRLKNAIRQLDASSRNKLNATTNSVGCKEF